MLSSAAQLERLIHDMEFENTQMVKLIQNEEQEIEVLKTQKNENTEEMNKVEKENSELDEMIKHFHSLFTRNRQSIENSKRTLTILHEHEDALTRELQMFKLQAEAEKKKREMTLAKYQGIWEEYSEVYETFDQTIQLRKLQAANTEAQKKLETLKQLYRQQCLSSNFKFTWVHEKNAIVELATAWLENKKREDQSMQAMQEKGAMSPAQVSDKSDGSDEQMEFHDATEYPQSDDVSEQSACRDTGVPQGEMSDVVESMTSNDVVSTSEEMLAAENENQLFQQDSSIASQQSVENMNSHEGSIQSIGSMNTKINQAALRSTKQDLHMMNQMSSIRGPPRPMQPPLTAPSHFPGMPQSPALNPALNTYPPPSSVTMRPSTINLPLRAPPPVRSSPVPQQMQCQSLFIPPMVCSSPAPLATLQQRTDTPLMPPPPTPPITQQRRSPPKLLVPKSPNIKSMEVVLSSANISAPTVVNIPTLQSSLQTPRSPKKALLSSPLEAPCTPSRPPRKEVDSTLPSTSNASTKANEILQTPSKPTKSPSGPVFKTPPSHMGAAHSSKESPFNFDVHHSFLQSFAMDSPGSNFRLPQKTMFSADAKPSQKQEKPKSFMTAADSSTTKGSPQVMSFLGSPWPASFGAGDASALDGSFNLEGLFGASAGDSAKDAATEALPSFSFGSGGPKDAPGGRNVMAMFGEGDNQDSSDEFSFSFGKSALDSSPTSNAFKLF